MGIIGSLCIILHGLIWWNEFTKQAVLVTTLSMMNYFCACLLNISVKLKILMLMFNLIRTGNGQARTGNIHI